jgi:large subunit ribosomal protein L22
MQQAKAINKTERVSPRKARLAAGLIRGLQVDAALAQLSVSPLKSARILSKTLVSAIANAENNLEISRKELTVKEVRVDDGPRYKRAKARSKGGRSPILKRTSHFTVVVGS